MHIFSVYNAALQYAPYRQMSLSRFRAFPVLQNGPPLISADYYRHYP